MGHNEILKDRKRTIAKQLINIKLPQGKESSTCWIAGQLVGVSGVTVRNYLNGKVADGYLADQILLIFEELKLT